MAIEAKYLRPRLDHVSVRPDARSAFAAAFDHRLTVVCAPAGYGKTTTTAAALERCGRPAVWYKLDILDHDPITFLAAMTRAVRRLHPRFGSALLRELEAGPVLDVPPQVLAAQFCSECDRLVRTHGHVVLDDYHETMDAAGMNEVLGYLLENCPETIHFVVLTRYEPAFRLEKLRLGGEVARIPRDLLLFDAAQVAEVLSLRSGRRHDQEFVHRLLALTEGWPASVVLAGMALEWLDPASLEDALADPRLRMDVFSYLAEQVFQRQTEAVQAFLLRTCCVDALSAELAERLTGSGSASRHLHFLARNQVFTFDAGRKGTYRYHNLLRDFLRQRFVQDEGEQAFRTLQLETASALEAYGDSAERHRASSRRQRARTGPRRDRPRRRDGAGAPPVRATPDLGGQTGVGRGSRADRGRLSSPGCSTRARAGSRPRSRRCVSRPRRLQREGDRDGLYQVLSITEWAEFWSGDCAASIAHLLPRPRLRLDGRPAAPHAAQPAVGGPGHAPLGHGRRRRPPGPTSSFPERDRKRPRERRRCALTRRSTGETCALPSELIQGCHDSRQTAAQRAATLNTHGMIDIALGDYESAARHLQEAATTAEGFGHALTSYMIEDNIAFLDSAHGCHRARLWLGCSRACRSMPTL